MIWKRGHKNELHAREEELAARESRVRAREAITGEQDVAMIERENALDLRERALRARAEADAARSEQERLMVQMREANERLVLATLRADEAVERAVATRAVEAENATVETERRRRAEALATQLRASEVALRASEGKAQASIRAKDEFLAMLGHELRNPLAPILIALDLIAMDRNDPHGREHAIIERQVTQLVQLVDDLLDLSRIASAKIELRRQPVELAEAVSRAVEMARPLIDSKKHALTVEVPAGLKIHGDPLRMTQVIGNLLTNAAKYTPSGGSIVVTGERRDARVVLRVRDTGIGLSNAMLPRIFDLYAQEHQASEGGPGGLGLGLAIVKSLVTLHGGTVTARSDGLGRGTELVVELPALGVSTDSAVTSGPPLEVEPVAPRRLLLVDDNRLVADLTRLALEKLGHDVRVAYDGASALAIAEGFAADVVLLDVGLPGSDGYEVARRLRAALSPHDVHFIAVTGYGQPSDHQRSADAGFDDHLVKPVALATLQHSIDRSMPGRGRGSGVTRA